MNPKNLEKAVDAFTIAVNTRNRKRKAEYAELSRLYKRLEMKNRHEAAEKVADKLSEMELRGYHEL